MADVGVSSRSSSATTAMVLPRGTSSPASISCFPAPRLWARAMAETRASRVPAMDESSRRAARSILEELQVINQDPPAPKVLLADHLLGRGAILQIAAMRPSDRQGQRAPPVTSRAPGKLHGDLGPRDDVPFAQGRAISELLFRLRPYRFVSARGLLQRHPEITVVDRHQAQLAHLDTLDPVLGVDREVVRRQQHGKVVPP